MLGAEVPRLATDALWEGAVGWGGGRKVMVHVKRKKSLRGMNEEIGAAGLLTSGASGTGALEK